MSLSANYLLMYNLAPTLPDSSTASGPSSTLSQRCHLFLFHRESVRAPLLSGAEAHFSFSCFWRVPFLTSAKEDWKEGAPYG